MLKLGSKYAGMYGLIPNASDMKSVAILPLLNLPVGFPPRKSRPYGWKLLRATVDMKLLFPASTDESPNTMIAGTLAPFTKERSSH